MDEQLTWREYAVLFACGLHESGALIHDVEAIASADVIQRLLHPPFPREPYLVSAITRYRLSPHGRDTLRAALTRILTNP